MAALAWSALMVPRCWARERENRYRAVSCAVNALVEATQISGPAWVMIVPAASRVIIEPTTLQMASVLDPLALASRWAAMVSAVSPDWVISMVRVSGVMMGS